ncbi:MAG TPA: tetratricopeptide repeat protein, partial [Anaerolineales bacterium]|nr:tetratricopeptide repeat protein [Anaerolineales bacterium]
MAEDIMLQEAIEAIRQGKNAKAKEILTRLLKADQQNASYWVWMSAAVATKKERIYALKTALRADPKNASAKRGLVLLGKIPPDENMTPFPLHHPRIWEEKLTQAKDEEEKKTEAKGKIANPIVRLAGIALGVVGIIGIIIFGLSHQNTQQTSSVTLGPTPTYTHTPTAINAKPTSTQAYEGSTPLLDLLDVPYTPTPLYVNTPRSVQASDYGYAVKSAYENEDWEALITTLEQIATLEPDSADPYYYIGEAYRFMGKNSKAFKAYEKAIDIDDNFGPPHLGQARVLPYINAKADIRSNLDAAIEKDPNFAEAYIERAIYWLEKEKYEKAYDDIEKARELTPGSPLVYFNLAKVYRAQDELENAL